MELPPCICGEINQHSEHLVSDRKPTLQQLHIHLGYVEAYRICFGICKT